MHIRLPTVSLGIFFLSVFSAGCSSTSMRELDRELTKASMETVYEATAYELQNDPVGAALVGKIDTRKLFKDFDREAGLRNDDLYPLLEKKISGMLSLTDPERSSLEQALDRAKKYLGLPNRKLMEEVPAAVDGKASLPADTMEGNGWSSEVKGADVLSARWNGIDAYVKSRLGPITVALDSLSSKDMILISNLGIQEILQKHPDFRKVEELTLPISSYGKKLHWLTDPSGNVTLVISEIKGEVLLRHFQMLIKRHLEMNKLQPRISVVESKQKNEGLYSSLSDFWEKQKMKLGKVKGVIFGYPGRYRAEWKKYFRKSVEAPSKDWTADLYELPSHRRVAVVSTENPMHGEILAKSFGRLMKRFTEIHYFFGAGSGGALIFGPPNRITYPGSLSSSEEVSIPNSLAPSYHRVIHRSVFSPLEENPEFMSALARQGVGSIDMEFGHLAEEMPKGSEVGVGITVTDFPMHPAIMPEVSLTSKNTAALKEATHEFIQSVYGFLVFGKKARISRPEKLMDADFGTLSRQNLLQLRRSLGKLSSAEEGLLKSMRENFKPDFYIRVPEARAWRIFTDGTFLSTGSVKDILKREVSPTTPIAEDQIYGAFDQIFGGIAANTGRERYGNVALKVRPQVWMNRSWGSEYSAFRAYSQMMEKEGQTVANVAIASEDVLEKVRKVFGKLVFVPEDYREAMIFRTLADLRQKEEGVRKKFLKAKNAIEWTSLMNEYDFGYIEGKIEYSLNSEDFESASVPKESVASLCGVIRSRGVKCEAFQR